MEKTKGTVVRFNGNHRWCGCSGIIDEARELKAGTGLPVSRSGEEEK